MALTDSKIRAAKPTDKVYRLPDRDGLSLEVRPTGAKFWRFRYRLNGKEGMYAAGDYVQPQPYESAADVARRLEGGQLTLAEARAELLNWRAAVKSGRHPAEVREERLRQRRPESNNTFKAVFEEWVADHPKWSATYRSQIQRTFATHVLPLLGHRPIKEITPTEVKSVIRGMKRQRGRADSAKASTEFKALHAQTKKWCSAVFQLSVENQLRDDDPTSGLKSIKKQASTNHLLLTEGQCKALLQKLAKFNGSPVTLAAIRLLMLTFVRTGELRQAQWSEFDLEAGVWEVPAARMKRGLELVVPLSRQAIEGLTALHQITGTGKLLFPNSRDPERPMSATTINRSLERMGFNGAGTIGFSAHGFRTFASTHLNEHALAQGFSTDAIERQLAHVDRKKVRGVYNKAQYMPERVRMMQFWADYVQALTS